MRRLSVVGLALSMACAASLAQDLPPQHKEAAERAFTEGFDYYIWYEGTEPLTATNYVLQGEPMMHIPPSSGVLVPSFNFHYLAKKSPAPPHRQQLAVTAFNANGTESVRLSVTSSEDEKPKTQSGTESSMFGANQQLKGEGFLEVYFIGPGKPKVKKAKDGVAEGPRHVSNTLRLRVAVEEKTSMGPIGMSPTTSDSSASGKANSTPPEPAAPGAARKVNTAKASAPVAGKFAQAIRRTINPPGSWWVYGVEFSSNGKWLITHRGVEAVYAIFDAATGAENNALDKLEPDGHGRISISPDGTLCAVSSRPRRGESNVKLYRFPEFMVVRTFRDETFSTDRFWWTPDSKSLLVEKGGDVSLWSIETGQMRWTVHMMGSVMAISPDGKYVASAMESPMSGGAHAGGYRVQIVPIEAPAKGTSFVAHKEWIAALAFSPDSNVLVSVSADKMVKLWSMPDMKPIRTLEGHDWVVKGVQFTADGKMLVSGSIDESVRFWDAATGAEAGLATLVDSAVTCLAITPDGSTIALGDEQGRVTLYDLQKLKALAQAK